MTQIFKIFYIILSIAFFLSCSSEGKDVKPADVYAVELAVKSIVMDDKIQDNKLTNLMYVFHSQSEGGEAIVHSLSGEQSLKLLNDSKIVSIEDKLEVGKYHVSVLAWSGNAKMTDKGISLLKKPYAEAVCQVDPHSQFYFGSADLEVQDTNSSKVEISLSPMLKPYIFKFSDVDSIPNEAEVQISVIARNLPQAFYLKDKATLTNEEEIALNIDRFRDAKDIDVKPASDVFAHYFLLNNDDLKNSGVERGTLSIVCQIAQDVSPKITSKIVNEVFPSTSLGSSHVYTAKIYSTDAPARAE